MTVFVPSTIADAQTLRETGETRDLVGYADGPGLRRWLGDSRVEDEEADYVALNHAGVAALLLDGSATRLVLAVDSDVQSEDDLGAVQLPVAWRDMRSLFADDPSAAEAVAAARRAVVGLELADALAVTEAEALQNAHDLLWFTPDELDTLADPA